ncbi:permease [Paenibacillus mendelii]|uniref:Permease n=1 Tax=Paenibacillus mendelii TaxID=206163 RepID=A0ABV6JEH2_9BACL|nr:permease [Paenibacillus mendelii]MCQ6557168.1 permease [Paenibacillus mendelii]
MFAGHFGIAAAVKSKSPEVPLWALMVSTQLLDVLFVPLFVTGVETIEGSGYGGAVIHADYTHSLIGALLITALAGMFAKRQWGNRGGRIVAGVVFSHWLLDLCVHRADLPILPSNFGNLPLLGLGIWEYSSLSIVLEGVLIGVGFLLYLQSVVKERSSTGWAIVSGGMMGVLLVLALVTDVFGI